MAYSCNPYGESLLQLQANPCSVAMQEEIVLRPASSCEPVAALAEPLAPGVPVDVAAMAVAVPVAVAERQLNPLRPSVSGSVADVEMLRGGGGGGAAP